MTAASEITATFTKLRSGDWGLRVTGTYPKPGEYINVSRRDGTTTLKQIGRVLFANDDVALCSIKGVFER